VCGDVPTIPSMSSWSAVTNLQHQEHVIGGHRLLVFLLSPSTVRTCCWHHNENQGVFEYATFCHFPLHRTVTLTKLSYMSRFINIHHFSDSKVCVGIVAPFSKFCASNAFIQYSFGMPCCGLLFIVNQSGLSTVEKEEIHETAQW
jgi:hypothetical protein